jgi:hypothetical protein
MHKRMVTRSPAIETPKKIQKTPVGPIDAGFASRLNPKDATIDPIFPQAAEKPCAEALYNRGRNEVSKCAPCRRRRNSRYASGKSRRG